MSFMSRTEFLVRKYPILRYKGWFDDLCFDGFVSYQDIKDGANLPFIRCDVPHGYSHVQTW